MSDKPSLKKRAIRGTAISIVAQGAKQILRLGSNLVLTRLLFPEAFGIMALVNMLIIGLAMVSDIGVQTSIIQNERGDDPEFLDTGWTIQVARGVLLWLIGCAIAIPMAAFYGEAQLELLIPVACLSAVFQGLESTNLATLNRHIDLARMVTVEVVAQVVGIVVMIALAFAMRSVWALAIGTLVSSATLCLLSHTAIAGRRNRFRWEREAARVILSFGAWIFVSTLITFLALRLDVMLLGKLIPVGLLGVYSIGTMLSQLPTQIGGPVVNAVLLPALSASARDDHETLKSSFLQARQVVLPTGLFVTLGPALLGPAFFYFLYDDRYADAGWIVQLSMVSAWFFYLHVAWSRALLAVGDSKSLAISNMAKLVGTIAGCLLGFHFFELPGFILGIAVGAIAGHVVILVSLARRDLAAGALDLRYSVAGLVLGIAGARLPHLITAQIGGDVVVVSAIVGVVILVPLGLWAGRGVLAKVRAKSSG